MSLDDLIRAYAAKGELVHLSLIARPDGKFYANFASASPGGGYAQAHDADPVKAIELAFKASPAKRASMKRRDAVTAAVTDPEPTDLPVGEPETLPQDWTTP